MKLALLTSALALPHAVAIELRGVTPHDLVGALQLPWLEAHCEGCQPDYCYPKGEDEDFDCYKKGYPKCCTKDKGNCPNNSTPECECLPGNCTDRDSDEVKELRCTRGDSTCIGKTFCRYADGVCGDSSGRCMEMPKSCNRSFLQVCGCNGMTYNNECEANSVGISVDYEGACGEKSDDDEYYYDDDDDFYDGECVDLGDAAAEHIVLDHFCSPGSYSTAYTVYDRRCKNTAYDVCEDGIEDVADRWCPNKDLSNNKLAKMQDKCVKQVDSMVD